MTKYDYKAVLEWLDRQHEEMLKMVAEVGFYVEPEHLQTHATLRHALLLAIGGGWQPIETAPRDGSHIICYMPYGTGFIMQTHWATFRDFSSQGFWWCDSGEVCPTHWMPLPAPPAMIQQAEREIG